MTVPKCGRCPVCFFTTHYPYGVRLGRADAGGRLRELYLCPQGRRILCNIVPMRPMTEAEEAQYEADVKQEFEEATDGDDT